MSRPLRVLRTVGNCADYRNAPGPFQSGVSLVRGVTRKAIVVNSVPGRPDLAAFLAVLVTGIVLIHAGVSPGAVLPVALGLSVLYAAWRPAPPLVGFRCTVRYTGCTGYTGRLAPAKGIWSIGATLTGAPGWGAWIMRPSPM